jgi:hypothetical protein
MLKAEKQNAARIKLKNNIKKLKTSIILTVIVKNTGIMDITTPNINEENISPKIIAQMEVGQHKSLSNVLERASQGIIDGPTDVAVKNAVIPISPGSNSFKGMLLPML